MIALLLVFFSSLPYYRARPPERPRALNSPLVWVYFTDKGFKTELGYHRVAEHLSPKLTPKAIERRIRNLKRAYNFDDLPLYEPYIDAIEELGGRLRHRSNWLNAASFELDPEAIPEVSSLPFVYKVEPVASYKRQVIEELRPLKLLRQQEDTTEFKEFYGGSYHQVAMLNIPRAYFRGYTGSGVLVGLLDTGFKRRRWLGEDSVHRALAHIRPLAEHDFLAGDNFWLLRGQTLDPIPGPQNLSLVQFPTIATDYSGRVHLFYVADTIEFGRSQRWLFWSYSKDQGKSWTDTILSKAYSHGDPVAVSRGDTLFLAYTRFGANERFGEVCFQLWDGTWWSLGGRIGEGENPHLSYHKDGLYLVYSPSPHSLAFRYGALTPAGVEWGDETVVTSGEPRVLSPRVLVVSSGEVKLFWVEQPSGRILFAGSADTGKTFSEPRVIIDSGAYRASGVVVGDTLHLLWQDYTQAPLVSLSYLRFTPQDRSRLNLTGPLPVMGGFSIAAHSDTVWAAYETQGMVYRLLSSDGGRSFKSPQAVDTSGFAYRPSLSQEGRYLVWIQRGDGDTDYEPEEDYITQPDHGTRMLSIIGGCQPGQLVGVAPGARFLVAKTERHPDPIGGKYEYIIEEDTWVEGLEWLERCGADIVSSSLGYSEWYSYEDMDGRTSPASVAASRAAERGLIVVTAAGNRGEDRPAPYLVAPGDAEGVVTVGGVEIDTLWQPGEPFPLTGWWDRSGFGPTPDGRMKPELVAPATLVVVVAPDSLNAYDWSGGTSCATALVAGCFALLKEAHPDWDAKTLKKVLFETASNYRSPNDTLGYGVPNLDSAIHYKPPIDPFYANSLGDPFPNPFIPSRDPKVYLPFQMVKPSWVRLSIYTIDGELVRRLETPPGILMPGRYYGTRPDDPNRACWWDGKDQAGLEVASGIYLVLLQSGYGGDEKKVVLIR